MSKFLFFDVANTLLHKRDLWQVWQNVLEDTGIELNEIIRVHKLATEIVVFPDKTNRTFYDKFNSEVLLALGILPAKGILDRLFTDCSTLKWHPFSDLEALKFITFPMGIISNWDNQLDTFISQLEIPFRPVVGSANCGYKKPDIQIYQLAKKELNKNYDDVYFIGDSLKLDIIPAQSAGMNTVLVDRDNIYPHYEGVKVSSLFELKNVITHEEE